MTESSNTEAGEPTPGIVERLARDDVERKRFLKMAGKRIGAGAAATSLAAFIAACGSSSSTASLGRDVERRGRHVERHDEQHDQQRRQPPPARATWRSSTTR